VKTAVTVAVGLVAGFFAGIVLSEIIAIIGFLISGNAVGIKYLPIYLAVACAVVTPAVHARTRRRSR
jgi:hypothetical protein